MREAAQSTFQLKIQTELVIEIHSLNFNKIQSNREGDKEERASGLEQSLTVE